MDTTKKALDIVDRAMEKAIRDADSRRPPAPKKGLSVRDQKISIKRRIAERDGGPLEDDSMNFWARLDRLDGRGPKANLRTAVERLDALDRRDRLAGTPLPRK